MIRCVLLAVALTTSVAHAQVARTFPADALRGDLQVQVAPDVLMDGKPLRLAPGSRIRGDTNLLVLPGELFGQRVRVHYTQEADGLVKDVWILNPAELANKRWPVNREQAARWRFDPATQIWSTP